jgi:hypothetical protein
MENMILAARSEIVGVSLQAEGPRFEPATAHHQIKARSSIRIIFTRS